MTNRKPLTDYEKQLEREDDALRAGLAAYRKAEIEQSDVTIALHEERDALRAQLVEMTEVARVSQMMLAEKECELVEMTASQKRSVDGWTLAEQELKELQDQLAEKERELFSATGCIFDLGAERNSLKDQLNAALVKNEEMRAVIDSTSDRMKHSLTGDITRDVEIEFQQLIEQFDKALQPLPQPPEEKR